MPGVSSETKVLTRVYWRDCDLPTLRSHRFENIFNEDVPDIHLSSRELCWNYMNMDEGVVLSRFYHPGSPRVNEIDRSPYRPINAAQRTSYRDSKAVRNHGLYVNSQLTRLVTGLRESKRLRKDLPNSLDLYFTRYFLYHRVRSSHFLTT